jgi:thiamine-phosphate pyrophosphorylase
MRDDPLPGLVAATDDRRLTQPDFTDALETMLEAGLRVVWLRSRTLDDRAFSKLIAKVRKRTDRHDAELWIGDRADLARAFDADGVQLPERGLSIAGARRVVGQTTRVGRSVHSVKAAIAAARDGADHLVVGAIYATQSHPGVEPAGVGLLEEIRSKLEAETLPALPRLAIGGVTPERVPEVVAAGVHGVVAIRALWDATDPGRAVREFRVAIGQNSAKTLH